MEQFIGSDKPYTIKNLIRNYLNSLKTLLMVPEDNGPSLASFMDATEPYLATEINHILQNGEKS